MYKTALNTVKDKADNNKSIKPTKKRWNTRPQTSNSHHSKIRSSRLAYMSDGFKFNKISIPRVKQTNKSFLEIKSKELHRPIHKEDYENIYAVSTTNFFENLVENDDNIDSNDANFNETDNIEIDQRTQILKDKLKLK